MTLDEAIATFKRELPNWYWSVTECSVSIHGYCQPDGLICDDGERGIPQVEAELYKSTSPFYSGGPDPTAADLIVALIEKAALVRSGFR